MSEFINKYIDIMNGKVDLIKIPKFLYGKQY